MSKNPIAIIPARGGSKRIPGKNIKEFCGQPLIAYSIKAALESNLFEKVFISTDDEEIAETAKKYGATIPFIRPKSIADDFTHLAPVVIHALTELEKQGFVPSYSCCILATAPFLAPQYLQQGLDTISSCDADTVFSITTFPYPIQRALKLSSSGCVELFYPEYELARSNDLEESYHDAGQFYWLNTNNFLKNKRIITTNSKPIILPRKIVQDIDTPEDWETAELLFHVAKQRENNV